MNRRKFLTALATGATVLVVNPSIGLEAIETLPKAAPALPVLIRTPIIEYYDAESLESLVHETACELGYNTGLSLSAIYAECI